VLRKLARLQLPATILAGDQLHAGGRVLRTKYVWCTPAILLQAQAVWVQLGPLAIRLPALNWLLPTKVCVSAGVYCHIQQYVVQQLVVSSHGLGSH
jgi:hypothetical protein